MAFRLSDTDIRQLYVFRAVVECRGFTAAQSVLNIGQSTISSQMSQLETRLGIRLCERGRTGFELTAKGKQVYEETLKLFRSHEDFQNKTAELKGRLSGFLNIAVIDNVVTDPNCPIVDALSSFNDRGHEVSIRLDILTPGDIERGLLDNDLDVAVGTFHNQVPGLDYRSIYVEHNELMCGAKHPLYYEREKQIIREGIADARKVTRAYLDKRDLFPLGPDEGGPVASVQSLEASAILILANGHIGFLPHHFAANWLDRGEMKVILPSEFTYSSEFSIVIRKSPRQSLILQTFLKDLYLAAKPDNAAMAQNPDSMNRLSA